MNKSVAFIFPETLPNERLVCPLLQVFDQVVYLQAIENGPTEQSAATPFITHSQQSGRLHPLTPVPLGDQRERFLALVGDMRRRGADYTSQLSMLSLAGLNRPDRAESNHSILSNLLLRSDIKEQQETELQLWQSRLILQLGEFYDTDQAELRKALHTIDQRQDTLLSELCDEGDNPFVLPTSTKSNEQEEDSILRYRLKAWSRLCFHGSNQQPGLLVTRHPATIDLMQEVYEKLRRCSARQLVSLELPCEYPASGHNATLDQPLVRQCPNLHSSLAIVCDGIASGQRDADVVQLFKEGQMEWSQFLDRRFPAKGGKRCVLDLFFFPEISAGHLCTESFNGGTVSGQQEKRLRENGCIVGLLRLN